MTFPCEANFSDLDYARAVYEQVVVRNLNAGTTTCCYYGTVHLAGTQVLADVIHRQGQRALVGKCNMDRNAPANCCDTSVTQSMEDTVALIDYIRSLPSTSTITTGKISHSPLVQPCVTPRFAIACTDDLLSSLGQLCSSDPTLAIQTHISENKLEISTTLDLFPSSKTYADVYDSFGLLREGTILAHAVHLGKQELHLIAGKGAGISHCPTSNFNLKSGGAKIGEMLDAGIKVSAEDNGGRNGRTDTGTLNDTLVLTLSLFSFSFSEQVGLGSDCSGGYALGVLPQLRNASSLSKLTALEYESAPPPSSLTVLSSASSFTGKSLPLAVLFHMATLGGASLCRLSSITGNFLPGKEFDALLVQSGKSPNFFTADLGVPLEKRRKWDAEKLKETFERFLFVSDDRDIADVYVRGRKVGGSRR